MTAEESPEPTGSRRESAVAQLSTLGHAIHLISVQATGRKQRRNQCAAAKKTLPPLAAAERE